MNKRIKQISFSVIIFISLISLISIPATMDNQEESLIVSIIDANYPPLARESEDSNETYFQIDLVYQVENPTGHDVSVTFVCGPSPFPYLRANLENKSIEIYFGFVLEWVEGISIKPPGIYNKTFPFLIIVKDYREETLPVGEYSLWFDFTNCSTVPLPVIVEKLIIIVTDSNVTYFFEHDNREETYTFETINYGVVGIEAIFIGVVLYLRKKKSFRNYSKV